MSTFVMADEIAREEAEHMLQAYCRTLEKLGYKPEPYPDLDAKVGGNIFAGGKFNALNHAYWMCQKTREFFRQGRVVKAFRWLGMIQGILFLGGVYSLSELRDHNGGVA